MGLAGVMSAAAETATMPSEVTLTSGRVLRNVQVVRWEKDRVVLKYSGGVDPIAFSLFKSPTPSEVAAMRTASAPAAKPKTDSRSIGGQVFVATKGAGSYKFGGAAVVILPLAAYDALRTEADNAVVSARALRRVLLSQAEGRAHDEIVRYQSWKDGVDRMTPIAAVTTDADGYYRADFKSNDPIFVFCSTYRSVGAFGEYNIWAVKVGSEERIDLNQANLL